MARRERKAESGRWKLVFTGERGDGAHGVHALPGERKKCEDNFWGRHSALPEGNEECRNGAHGVHALPGERNTLMNH
jgi:hypothetical protein